MGPRMNDLLPRIEAVGNGLIDFAVIEEAKRLGISACTNTRLVGPAAVLLATLALAGCGGDTSHVLQGWVEADLIFVSPDQQGRVENAERARGRRGQFARAAIHRR